MQSHFESTRVTEQGELSWFLAAVEKKSNPGISNEVMVGHDTGNGNDHNDRKKLECTRSIPPG